MGIGNVFGEKQAFNLRNNHSKAYRGLWKGEDSAGLVRSITGKRSSPHRLQPGSVLYLLCALTPFQHGVHKTVQLEDKEI